MSRRALILLVASIALGIAAPAQGAVTASNITAPTDGTHYLITDANPATNVTVTGTSSGTTGDHVDIRCYVRSDAWNTGAGNVAVAADGSFSTTMATDAPYGTCVLRAVPSGFPSSGIPSLFTGPVLTTEQVTSRRVSSGPNAGKVIDFYVLFQGAGAMNDYVSATRGGLWDSRLHYTAGQSSLYLWYENAALTQREASGTRSYLQIDGRNAYGPYSASQVFPGSSNNAGLPALTFDASREAATGNPTIHETDPIVVCPTETPFPPTAASCPQFNSAGVQLERTYFVDDGGRQVHITDTWRSTDGAAHVISAHYEQYVQAEDPVHASVPAGLDLPWLGGFQTFTSATTLAGPGPGAGSLFVRDNNNAPDSQDYPTGALSFDIAPSAVQWERSGQFALNDENVAVPAGGTAVVREDFVMGQTLAEVQAKALMNVNRFVAPSVTISYPANASTITGAARTKRITVTGSASDNVGLASLTLNGAPVTLAPAGSFSVPSTVTLGSNTFTAVARDAAGNIATASVTAGYRDTVAPSVTGFTASPRTFRVAAGRTPLTARAKQPAAPKGTTFKFTLSEDSKVSISIARILTGKRSGKRCVKPTNKLRRHRNCERLSSAGTLRRALSAGKKSVKFTGRMGFTKLTPGRYLATIQATDYAGHTSNKRTVKLQIVLR